LLSGIFVVGLMILGVREVKTGSLWVGALVTFLGYALFLLEPIRTLFEFAQKLILSLVSAEKTIHLLSHDSPWPPQEATALDPAAPLRDVTSGADFAPVKTTMIVPAEPQAGAALTTAWADTFPRSSPSPWTRSRTSPARQPGPPGSRAPQRG